MSEQKPSPISISDARRAFMRKEGFLMFTEANQELLNEIAALPLTAAEGLYAIENDDYDREYVDGVGPSLALFAVTKHIIDEQVKIYGYPERALRNIQATPQEKREIGMRTLIGGIEDQDFPWHFSAGVAASVAYEFIDAGVISQEEFDNLSLADWSVMIGSGWFRKLIHSMAYAANGTWGSFGNRLFDYYKGSLRDKLERRLGVASDHDLYSIQEKSDPVEGKNYTTAKLHPAIIKKLRQEMKEESNRSVGCPVARLACKISVEELEEVRVARLLQSGLLSVESKTDDTVILRQEMTTIDRTLLLFSRQLMAYHYEFGTPRYLPNGETGYQWDGHDDILETGVFNGRPLAGSLKEDHERA